MNIVPSKHRLSALLPVFLALPMAAWAGVFVNETPGKVTHAANYAGTGGERVFNVCLDPGAPPRPESGDPTQATENVLAEYNRFEGRLGNVVTAASVGVTGVDYESILMHELGHCMGLDHNVIGPSEASCSVGGSCVNSPTLFFANSFLSGGGGPNIGSPSAGTDGARGTGDDVRGAIVNRHWYRNNSNNPFIETSPVDRQTYRQSGGLPGGDNFAEAASNFSPCAQGTATSNTAAANGQPTTTDVMVPILCTNNAVRDLSPNDRSTFRIARAGFDGVAGNADDYTVRLNFQGTNQAGCDIQIRFPSGGGFFCQIGFFIFGNGDQSIGDSNPNTPSGVINLDRNANWFFNQNDTTQPPPQPCLFRSGFENSPVNCAG